jgi:hypothetical protein
VVVRDGLERLAARTPDNASVVVTGTPGPTAEFTLPEILIVVGVAKALAAVNKPIANMANRDGRKNVVKMRIGQSSFYGLRHALHYCVHADSCKLESQLQTSAQ